MPTPTVIDGLRGQRPAREAAAKLVPQPERVMPPGNGIVYLSKYERYRHQITSPREQLSPDGRIHREPPVVVQFEAGMYRNNTKDKKTRELIDKVLQESADFGIGRLFWFASDDEKARREKAAKETAYMIEHDPALKAEIERQVALRVGKSEDLPSATA